MNDLIRIRQVLVNAFITCSIVQDLVEVLKEQQ